MLERDGRRATVPFGALVFDPSNNIFVHPNDTIYMYAEPQTFASVWGDSRRNSHYGWGRRGSDFALGPPSSAHPFGAWRISLAEAVAKAGGFNDGAADPASVFLYRGELRQVAEQIGVDVSKFDGPIIPVIYEVNFRDPAGYFLAKQFDMRNKDIIYVSNAGLGRSNKGADILKTCYGDSGRSDCLRDYFFHAQDRYCWKMPAAPPASSSDTEVLKATPKGLPSRAASAAAGNMSGLEPGIRRVFGDCPREVGPGCTCRAVHDEN